MSEGKGGVEEYVMNLSRYIDDPSKKYGYLIMGESTVYEDELKKLGVEYFFIPQKKRIIANIQAYKNLLKKLRNDYSVMYFNTSGLYYPIPYLYAYKYKYKVVLHSHSTTGSKFKKLIHTINRIWISKHAVARLSCSTPAGIWMFGKNNGFSLVPNAVKLSKFTFNPQNRENCRNEYGLQDDFVIGTIGRLHWGKNQVFLVDILKVLLDRGIKTKLLLVGDGDMKAHIEKRAEEFGVKDKVVFTGQTNNSEFYYSAMDCFLLPSFAEGFPVTLIEAQANGIPCVVSDRVTKETNISGNIRYLSIDAGPQVWADEILNNKERYDCIADLKNKGYDVKDLEAFVWNYLSTDG